MFSFYYDGTVPMFPDVDNMKIDTNDKNVCCFKVPAIYYGAMSESFEEEPMYDWLVDSVTMVNDQKVVKYIESEFIEVLLKDKDGEPTWVNGKIAEILGIDIERREDVRVGHEYFVEIYDLEKGEKKRGKVTFEETSPRDEYDFADLKNCYPEIFY